MRFTFSRTSPSLDASFPLNSDQLWGRVLRVHLLLLEVVAHVLELGLELLEHLHDAGGLEPRSTAAFLALLQEFQRS